LWDPRTNGGAILEDRHPKQGHANVQYCIVMAAAILGKKKKKPSTTPCAYVHVPLAEPRIRVNQSIWNEARWHSPMSPAALYRTSEREDNQRMANAVVRRAFQFADQPPIITVQAEVRGVRRGSRPTTTSFRARPCRRAWSYYTEGCRELDCEAEFDALILPQHISWKKIPH